MKESYLKEVQQFLDKGKTQDYAEIVAFNALLPVSTEHLFRASKIDSSYQIRRNIP